MTDEHVYQVRGGGEIVVRGEVSDALRRRVEVLARWGSQAVVVVCEGEMRSVLFALSSLAGVHGRVRSYRLRMEKDEREAIDEYDRFVERTYDEARALERRLSKTDEKVRKRLRKRRKGQSAAAAQKKEAAAQQSEKKEQAQPAGGASAEEGGESGDMIEVEV